MSWRRCQQALKGHPWRSGCRGVGQEAGRREKVAGAAGAAAGAQAHGLLRRAVAWHFCTALCQRTCCGGLVQGLAPTIAQLLDLTAGSHWSASGSVAGSPLRPLACARKLVDVSGLPPATPRAGRLRECTTTKEHLTGCMHTSNFQCMPCGHVSRPAEGRSKATAHAYDTRKTHAGTNRRQVCRAIFHRPAPADIPRWHPQTPASLSPLQHSPDAAAACGQSPQVHPPLPLPTESRAHQCAGGAGRAGMRGGADHSGAADLARTGAAAPAGGPSAPPAAGNTHGGCSVGSNQPLKVHILMHSHSALYGGTCAGWLAMRDQLARSIAQPVCKQPLSPLGGAPGRPSAAHGGVPKQGHPPAPEHQVPANPSPRETTAPAAE